MKGAAWIVIILLIIIILVVPIVPVENCAKLLGYKVACVTQHVSRVAHKFGQI